MESKSIFPDWTRDKVVAAQAAHFLYPWIAQNTNTSPIVVDSGEGIRFRDMDGRRFLDFNSGLMNSNVGWNHPKVVAAMHEAIDRGWLFHSPQHGSPPRAMLAKKLADIAPGNLTKSFICNAGAEAVANAIKMARLVTGRPKIVSFYGSYHGSTGEGRDASGDPRHNVHGPRATGFVHVYGPTSYRCPLGYADGASVEVYLAHVRDTILQEGPETVAAIIAETVVGSNGLFIRPPRYLQGLRALADEFGILLILDEVMCGFGRTGKMFACEHEGIVPDMLVLAKGLTCGYTPLGAVVVSEQIARFFDTTPLACGLTYAGHALGCATAVATIGVYEEDGLVENSRRMGELMGMHLAEMKERHSCVGDVRSIGLFGVLDLVRDRSTKEPLSPWNKPPSPAMKAVSAKLLERGLYTFVRWGWVFVVPPLIIKEEELAEGFKIINEALELGDQAVTA